MNAVAASASLRSFVERHRRLFVLTGAGCSTDSGIPDYRDLEGGWKRPPPMTYQVFTGDPLGRARYWARSMIGWRHFSAARANATHSALASLERGGNVEVLVTQNVDGLHQAAGSRAVIDLHGRLDRVRCLQCDAVLSRAVFQQQLDDANPHWSNLRAAQAPDGDADLEEADFAAFAVPACAQCGGMMKPDVVFFGENVPRERLQRAMDHFDRADALLVIGSSLMVYSGYRFAAAAARRGMPIAAVNLGRNRADPLLELKLDCRCDEALAFLDASSVETEPA
ncbi:NAD-dependent protein deacetylase [Oleiagrimonas soli]|uniref:NAD-dependent protein deacetylase n=1 Tax=Oleiagrimonas soli TaxID=1543381 RepID=A0A099CX46_9GAMM|nr:NAD-dependent protein deacetylase [Oleiagrimonas soli]KGI78329.1 NAD-dependent deacetylase [Oleiagrimonas soli]MBB6183176.1 NAD-dependent SIR2 family protein deacetylase [Oleiagrimonas soli]